MIYLDNHATTQCDPLVIEAMLPYFGQVYGNPSSQSHKLGWDAKDAVEQARQDIAKSLGAFEQELIFNSGATESINFIIKSVAMRALSDKKNKKRQIITLGTEHKAVLESAQSLRKLGFEVTILRPEKNGILKLDHLKENLSENTLLVSCMFVNNEIGVIQEIAEIAAECQKNGALFHSDMAQAIGRVPVDLHRLNVDFASFASHKVYGPPGIGATFIKKSARLALTAFLHGGGQERGFRPGTHNVPGVVGFAKACLIASERFSEDHLKITDLRQSFLDILDQNNIKYMIHGCMKRRVAGNLSIAFEEIEAERLMLRIQKKVACSSGSACTSVQLEPSHVLKSIAVSNKIAHQSLRFGFGRFQTEKQIIEAATLISDQINNLKKEFISPKQ